MVELETKRLIIRPVSLTDKEAVFEYRSDQEINKYQSWIPQNIQDVENFIKRTSRQLNVPETWFQFVLIDKDIGQIIGDIGIHFLDEENRQVEIGCTLNKHFHSRGYATEAVERVMDFLFFDLKKHRVITSIDSQNNSSIRLVERLGFRKEAHFIKSLYLNGKWVDDLVYAILEREWEQRRLSKHAREC